eukprot:GHVR01038328.1.p1 GENE.GHVR01038328.1~~GHVR01038328.1.p1  ORF type:complete len:207 (+),score=-9.47 GHVR01038328.1:1348-1968(+)
MKAAITVSTNHFLIDMNRTNATNFSCTKVIYNFSVKELTTIINESKAQFTDAHIAPKDKVLFLVTFFAGQIRITSFTMRNRAGMTCFIYEKGIYTTAGTVRNRKSIITNSTLKLRLTSFTMRNRAGMTCFIYEKGIYTTAGTVRNRKSIITNSTLKLRLTNFTMKEITVAYLLVYQSIINMCVHMWVNLYIIYSLNCYFPLNRLII